MIASRLRRFGTGLWQVLNLGRLPSVRALFGILCIAYFVLRLVLVWAGYRWSEQPDWAVMVGHVLLAAAAIVLMPGAITDLLKRVRLQDALDRYSAKLNEWKAQLPDRGWASFGDEHLLAALLRMMPIPGEADDPGEGGYVVMAVLRRPDDFIALDRTLTAIAAAADILGSDETPGIALYTDVVPGCWPGSGDPSARRVLRSVLRIWGLTKRKWWFSRMGAEAWATLVWSNGGCIIRRDAEPWCDLCNAPAALGIEGKVRDTRKQREDGLLPRMCFGHIIGHLSQASGDLAPRHFADFRSNGYRFGNHSALFMSSIASPEASSTLVEEQGKENDQFYDFVKEILLRGRPTRVTAVWPLTVESVRYVASGSIARWHHDLHDYLHRNPRRPVSGQRYVLLSAEQDHAGVRFNTHETFDLHVPTGAGERHYRLTRFALAEAVIGKYFLKSLSLPNFHLFVVPVCDATWAEYLQVLQPLFTARSEQIDADDLHRRFISDWIMFECSQEWGDFTILQSDDPVAFWKTSDCLLQHRYAIAHGKLPPQSGCSPASCPFTSDARIARYCCLKYALSHCSGRLAPQDIKNAQSPDLRALYETILSRPAQYYEKEWSILLPDLGAELI